MADSIAEAMETAQSEAPTDRRSVMERAFTELDTGDKPVRSEAPEKQEISWSGEKSDAEEPVVKPVKPIKEELPETKRVAERRAPPVKDTDGKFVKQQKTTKVDGEPVPAEGAKTYKPPVSWKPDAREQFAKLSPRVQEEITKRESEISQALNSSAAARKFGTEFYNIIKPHEQLIRASGVTPMQAVANLVHTAACLQTGTPKMRAAIITELVTTYGVDIKLLDAMLSGVEVPNTPDPNNALTELLHKELGPVREFISTVQGRKQQSEQDLQQQVATEHQAFADDPKNEFFPDVQEEIADLLEVAARRGRKMTLKEAYDRACQSVPEIAKVINERTEAARAAEKASNYDRSRRASVSTPSGIPGGVGKPGGAAPVGRRSAIERAFEDLS